MDDLAKNVVARHLKTAITWNKALEVLGFPPGSAPTDAEVNRAYRQKYIDNRQLHPDTGGDPDVAVELNAAKDTLQGKLKPDYDPGFVSDPSRGPVPQGEPYKPPPARPKKRVTFEDALGKVAIPSGIKWLFITPAGYSGYSGDESERYSTVRVAVGDVEGK